MKYTFLTSLALATLLACHGTKKATPSVDSTALNAAHDTIGTVAGTQHVEAIQQTTWPIEHREELKKLFYQTIDDQEMDYDTLEYATDFDFDKDGHPDCIVRFVFAEEYKSPKKYYTSVLFTFRDSIKAIDYDEFHHDMTIFDGGKVSVYVPTDDSTFYTIHHAVKNGRIEKTLEYDNMNVDYINDTIHYRNFNYRPLFQ